MKRKILGLMMVGMLVFSLFGAALPARAAGTVGISIQSATAESPVVTTTKGSSFSVLIKIDASSPQQQVAGVDAFLNFDPTRLQVENITPMSPPFDIVIMNRFDNQAGTIDYSAGTFNPPVGSFFVANITFKAIEETPGTPLSFSTAIPRKTMAAYAGDDVTGVITGGMVVVQGAAPGPASKLVYTQQPSSTGTTAVPFTTQPVVQIQDQFGNLCATDNTTIVTLSPVLAVDNVTPGAGTLTGTISMAAAGGIATFFNVGYTGLDTINIKATSAALTSVISTVNITLAPGPVSRTFVVDDITNPVAVGIPSNVRVTAMQAGVVDPTYTGTIMFTSTDPMAMLPPIYTFTSGAGSDNGVHTFVNGVKFGLPGMWTVTATDIITPAVTGTSVPITVTPALAPVLDHVMVTPVQPSIPVASTLLFTATAFDQNNNIIPAIFTWSVMNPQAGVIDATGMFTAGIIPGTFDGVVQACTTVGSITKCGITGVTIIGTASNNDVRVTFITGPRYNTNGDSVENVPLTMANKTVSTRIENTPDTSVQPVTAPVLTFIPDPIAVVQSVDQENLVPPSPPYIWNLPDIAESEWLSRSARINPEVPGAVFTPGFSASRTLDRTSFTASGTQTLTITATPQEPMDQFGFMVRIMGTNFVDATIISPTSGSGVVLSADKKRLDINIQPVTVGTTYTKEVVIQVNLNPGVSSATFKPMVSVNARWSGASGDVPGPIVSRPTGLGTFTWQAAGNYLWHWFEQTIKGISFSEVQMGDIGASIATGLTWLVSQQQANGCWSPDYEPVAHTAFAVLKLEDRAFELGYQGPFDPAYPYKSNVESGLNYIFSNAGASGVGICFASGHHETYSTGIAMMAIAGSRAPGRVVNVPGSVVNNWSYKQVLQANVDYFVWGQCDAPSPQRGGWLYGPNQGGADNSNTGFAVLGLRYAEADLYGFKCPIPQTLKDELNFWITYIQRPDGGSDYNNWGTSNLLRTGNLLFEMAFVGDSMAAPTPRLLNAIAYIQNHWRDPNGDPGWQGNLHSMYCLMKGFQSLGIDTITVGGSQINWFDEISAAIVSNQAVGGYWDWGGWGRTLNTEFALLTLEKVAPPPPVSVVVDVPGCACDVAGYQVKVNYTAERFLVNGTLTVNKDGNTVDTVNLVNFTGTATYTRNVASDTPGTYIWKAVLDVTPVGGGTPGHAEGTDSVKVCESPKVAGIPDQTIPFHTFDLDNYLTYGGGLPVAWSASAPPPGWAVVIDANNAVTVTAPSGAVAPAVITFSASVICPPCGIICEGSDDAVFFPNQAPDCSKAYADPGCLWPPNHKLVSISIMGVTDPDSDPVTIIITRITSDEPTASDEGSGGAIHAPDAVGVGTGKAWVRAERTGGSDGRVYVISFTASDGKGGVSQGTVKVGVPHDQSPKECKAIDSGQKYDATQMN